MNTTNCKISDAEWIVIKVLWQERELTSTQIIERLSATTSWKPKTIHSLINRLVNKGAVGVNKEGSQFKFYAILDENDCVMEETRTFLKKVYDGSVKLMISNFINNEKLSENEIEELQHLLNKGIKK
ncbi:BlaI/MecI/CopY family transcriptional regulator [Clostridium sp. 19966]|uniref:BlaI/MecI/CopY family transcriptional regulator n=1 Tax=Clostridium sp. 19966 TaxID=2768166 RepID=UPI0028DF0994|nr:BlaI/MecI/CopY family transcriptional regulator [Clostridium sp. 19966]MDT8719557.1 BlaI/MecI/CopY family transcriptional regulator [Clostridium sp. 19966]